MKKILFSLFILLISLGLCQAEDTRTDKTRLRIMTLNAEFMWGGVDPEEGQVNFSWKNSKTEAEEHMERIAEIISRHNPDIVSLVEIENKEALDTLNSKFLQGMGYTAYFAKGRDTYTGQDMGLLTRIDPENNKKEYDSRNGSAGDVKKSVSKNYTATFSINNEKIALIGLHFLSGPNRSDRKSGREAQADAIRLMAVEKSNMGYEIIVLGDFNDYDGDSCCLDRKNSRPVTAVLENIKAMNPSSESDNLTNAAELIPKANRL